MKTSCRRVSQHALLGCLLAWSSSLHAPSSIYTARESWWCYREDSREEEQVKGGGGVSAPEKRSTNPAGFRCSLVYTVGAYNPYSSSLALFFVQKRVPSKLYINTLFMRYLCGHAIVGEATFSPLES